MYAHENGRELIGAEFQNLLYSFGISDILTPPYNTQGNSIYERMHLKVGNVLRSLIQTNLPHTIVNAQGLIDLALTTTMHVLRTNASWSTENSPGALVYHCDTIINIPLKANLCRICACCQLQVDDNLHRANVFIYDSDYQPDQKVLKKHHEFTNLGLKRTLQRPTYSCD